MTTVNTGPNRSRRIRARSSPDTPGRFSLSPDEAQALSQVGLNSKEATIGDLLMAVEQYHARMAPAGELVRRGHGLPLVAPC